MVYSSLRRPVSVRSRAGVTITHTPSTSDVCETHAPLIRRTASTSTSSSSFRFYERFLSGGITEEQRFDIIRYACPGDGACGGIYTVNTMALAIEIMDMTLLGSSLNPAQSKVEQLEYLTADGAINHPPIQQPDKKDRPH